MINQSTMKNFKRNKVRSDLQQQYDNTEILGTTKNVFQMFEISDAIPCK